MLKLLKLTFSLVLFTCISYASKIVSVGGSVTETIVTLGHADKLIGVDLSSAYPQEITSKLPKVGYWLRLPKEGILSLKPDIAIISSKAEPKNVVDNLSKFGIKTYSIDDNPSIESAKRKIKQVGDVLGESEKADKIIARIEKNILKIKKEIKGKKKPKVLYVLSREKGVMLAAGPKTKPGIMIELAGGQNALKFDQYSKISLESVLQMNPDVIIKTKLAGDRGLDNSIIASTNAGKNNQIYTMDMLLISGFTVRIDKALVDLTCMLNDYQLSYCK